MEPLVILNEFLKTAGNDEGAKDVALKAIEHVKGAVQSHGLDQIEVLGASTPGGLVQWCGVIVGEELEEEYFLPVALSKSGDWLNVGLFRDPEAAEGPVDEECMAAVSSSYKDLLPRRVFLARSPPGWSAWAATGQAVDRLRIVVYDERDYGQCRLGRTFTFYGVYAGNELHLVHLSDPLPEPHVSLSTASADKERPALLAHLTGLLGSETAGQLLLCNLVSSISERHTGLVNSLLIGSLPVNLVVEEDDDGTARKIVSLLQELRPAVKRVDVSAPGLDAEQLLPVQEVESAVLGEGALQLAWGTHLVLDETRLEPGQFTERATANLKGLMDLLDHQHLAIDFGYQAVHLPCDYPILGLSRSKPILSYPWSVKVQPGGEGPTLDFTAIRRYLAAARQVKVAIPEDISSRLEAAYVEERRACPAFDENAFARALNLAKLLAKAVLSPDLAWSHWTTAMAIHHAVSSN